MPMKILIAIIAMLALSACVAGWAPQPGFWGP